MEKGKKKSLEPVFEKKESKGERDIHTEKGYGIFFFFLVLLWRRKNKIKLYGLCFALPVSSFYYLAFPPFV